MYGYTSHTEYLYLYTLYNLYIYIYLHLSSVLYSVLSLNGNMPVLSAHTLLTCHLNGGSVKSRLSGGVDPEDSVPHG